MLAMIGLVMSAYVFTRCVSFLSRSGERAEGTLVKVLSAVTAAVSLLGTAYFLFGSGSSNL